MERKTSIPPASLARLPGTNEALGRSTVHRRENQSRGVLGGWSQGTGRVGGVGSLGNRFCFFSGVGFNKRGGKNILLWYKKIVFFKNLGVNRKIPKIHIGLTKWPVEVAAAHRRNGPVKAPEKSALTLQGSSWHFFAFLENVFVLSGGCWFKKYTARP